MEWWNGTLEWNTGIKFLSHYTRVYRISGIFGEHYIWRMKVKTDLIGDQPSSVYIANGKL